MADYQQMYLKLFNKITDVIEELQQIQEEVEELLHKRLRAGFNRPETAEKGSRRK